MTPPLHVVVGGVKRAIPLPGVTFPPTSGNPRAALVSGTYKPNNSSVVGLLPGVALEPVYPTSGQAIPLDLTYYKNKIFWGQVIPPVGGGKIVFDNCLAAGPDPASYGSDGQIQGNIKSFDSASVYRAHIDMIDGLISCAPWLTDTGLGRPLASSATRTINPLSAGLHGGNMTLRRVEIADVQDGVNYTNGNDNTYFEADACWVHHLYYQNGWTGPGSPSSQDTHSDGFQFNRGKHIYWHDGLMGGTRNQAAYDTTPPGGYNGGDDGFGAGFMCKQEAGYTAYDQIHDVRIDHNWIEGWEYSLNMVYRASRPYLWDDAYVTNNIFSTVRRPQYGRFINKSAQLTPIVSGNVDETGAPVVAQNSGYSE